MAKDYLSVLTPNADLTVVRKLVADSKSNSVRSYGLHSDVSSLDIQFRD
jgi:hypothetical protein